MVRGRIRGKKLCFDSAQTVADALDALAHAWAIYVAPDGFDGPREHASVAFHDAHADVLIEVRRSMVQRGSFFTMRMSMCLSKRGGGHHAGGRHATLRG